MVIILETNLFEKREDVLAMRLQVTSQRARGSHRQYKHPQKKGLVTVPGHMNDELAPGTVNSILKQAGLKSITLMRREKI